MELGLEPLPFILSIDTSTAVCSVAIAQGKHLIAEEVDDSGDRKHAALLPMLMESARIKAGIPIEAIEAICCSQGPGSYTGLRVGLSTAKGMCMALKRPLIGVSTLVGIAHAMITTSPNTYIVAMIDAGRDEVFHAVFDSQYRQIEPASPLILKSDSLVKWLDKSDTIYIVGDGVQKAKNILKEHSSITFGSNRVLASYFVIPAFNKFIEGKFENLAYSVPEYLKAPNYTKSI